MGNGFLDDLPDLGMDRRKKKRHKEAPATEEHTKAVIWQPVRCPECKGGNCPVHTTRKPIRYHKCNDCGCLFKSIEQNPQKSP